MNILVIGNGFDLAHKLPTRYNDFIGFVERFLNIINTPQILQQGELKNTEKTVYEYIDHLIFNEQQLCKELEQLVKDNIWIEYFLQNPMYQKENWIDFENEISKVIQSLDQDMFFKDGEKSELSEKMQDLSNPFLHKKYSKYTAAMRTASALTHGKGESITYKEIRDRLYNDLNKLIRALEIYLTDYVEKEECNCVLPDIQEIVKENVKGADGEEQINIVKCCLLIIPIHMNGFIWINSRYKIALIISMARQNSLIPWKTIIWFLGLMSILRMKEKTGKRSLLLLRNFIREFIKRLDVNIRIGWRQFGKNMMIFYRKRRE